MATRRHPAGQDHWSGPTSRRAFLGQLVGGMLISPAASALVAACVPATLGPVRPPAPTTVSSLPRRGGTFVTMGHQSLTSLSPDDAGLVVLGAMCGHHRGFATLARTKTVRGATRFVVQELPKYITPTSPSIRYAPQVVVRVALLVVLGAIIGLPLLATAQVESSAPAGYPGQSNLVPVGMPTPTTAFEQLSAGGPARDPGPLDWAQPGPYMQPNWSDFALRSFSSRAAIATTYYFYWHDLTDPARRERFVGRYHSPPDPMHYSFLLPETHQREFNDMIAADLDFVLPVYWGEPGHPGRTTSVTSPHYWSTEGIPAMVEALDRNRALGTPPLQMGMFYDTTILANADLTTPAGREYFYVNVRDYYSRIPPRYWAAIDDKPIVWLYDTIWISKFDQSSIDYLSDRFAKDFGGLRLFVVRESQWQGSKSTDPPASVTSEGLYAWGAAPFGFNTSPELTVAEVGPGFKNTQYCTGGAERNCFDTDREGGVRYERQLQQAVASGRHILAAETWNEFSEGTDIQETVETGRQYIELTRRYVDALKGVVGATP